jgi:hypothetical protein
MQHLLNLSYYLLLSLFLLQKRLCSVWMCVCVFECCSFGVLPYRFRGLISRRVRKLSKVNSSKIDGNVN